MLWFLVEEPSRAFTQASQFSKCIEYYQYSEHLTECFQIQIFSSYSRNANQEVCVPMPSHCVYSDAETRLILFHHHVAHPATPNICCVYVGAVLYVLSWCKPTVLFISVRFMPGSKLRLSVFRAAHALPPPKPSILLFLSGCTSDTYLKLHPPPTFGACKLGSNS